MRLPRMYCSTPFYVLNTLQIVHRSIPCIRHNRSCCKYQAIATSQEKAANETTVQHSRMLAPRPFSYRLDYKSSCPRGPNRRTQADISPPRLGGLTYSVHIYREFAYPRQTNNTPKRMFLFVSGGSV